MKIQPRIQGLAGLAFILLLSLQTVQAVCIKAAEVCAEGAEWRTINGLDLYRSCWRYTLEFTCDGTIPIPDAHCQALIDEGCSPVRQTCDADSCIQTYECVTGTAVTQTGVGCETQNVQVGNVVFDTGYAPSTDLGKAASSMAALESAVTGMIKNDASCTESPAGSGHFTCAQPILIFNGASKKCRKDSLGFNVCCNLSGWGVDSGLNVCNAQEEELGYARQAGRTVYVGSYCTHSNVFGCYAHAYVYCAFPSKIGRIVQEQGRTQLRMGWGSPSNPHCQGFTNEQLATIDFELIDFSEYFGDAFAEMIDPPTSAEMEGIVNTYINTLQNSECSQFGCSTPPEAPPEPPPDPLPVPTPVPTPEPTPVPPPVPLPEPPVLSDPGDPANWSTEGFYTGPGDAALLIANVTTPFTNVFIGLGDINILSIGIGHVMVTVGDVTQYCSIVTADITPYKIIAPCQTNW